MVIVGSSSTLSIIPFIIQLANRLIRHLRITSCTNLFTSLLSIPTHLANSFQIKILFLATWTTLEVKAAKTYRTRSSVAVMGWCLASLLIKIQIHLRKTFSQNFWEEPTAVPTRMENSSAPQGKMTRVMDLRPLRLTNFQGWMIQWYRSRKNRTVIKAIVSKVTAPTRNKLRRDQQRPKATATFSKSLQNKRNLFRLILELEAKVHRKPLALLEVGLSEIR